MGSINRSLLALLISLVSFKVLATEKAVLQALPPVNITGTARTMAGDEIYREFHRLGKNHHSVDYQRPDGSWLAHKQISYGAVDGISSFKLHYPGTNRRETVVAEAGKVQVDIVAGGKKTEHRMNYREGDVIDAGFDSLIRNNWDKVVNKESFKTRFLLFRRGSWVSMTLSSANKAECLRQFESDITHCISIRPESLFLRILAPELILGYNDNRQLRLYVGPSNLKLEKRKPSSLVITYQYSNVVDT